MFHVLYLISVDKDIKTQRFDSTDALIAMRDGVRSVITRWLSVRNLSP